ncbi:hypothetical protein SDC9_90063 [bioreactor metagenome]|uniref:Uncharacterized protein n=1 Tax=bioreactor metagenome TaxID=1076179 RepID=A0A644ZQY8_9ZZZZ
MILQLSVLEKKVAFVMGNRNVNKKNLNKKKKSIAECGQLVPLIILDGSVVVDKGLTIVDFETGNEIQADEAHNYIVIIEGQHRYAAIIELQEEDEKNKTSHAPDDVLVMYAQSEKGISVKKLISELNSTSVIWNGKDIVAGAAMCNPTDELLKYVKELTDLKSSSKDDNLPRSGYLLSTISKLVTFTPRLDKKVLSQSMDDGTEKLPTANIKRAKEILECALEVGFTHKYLSHRYFIDWFMDEVQREDGSYHVVCDKVSKLSKQQVDEIMKIKSGEFVYEIRQIANEANTVNQD